MKLYIIQLLIIIPLAIICGLLEVVNTDLILIMYRGTITYVISKKLAILINKMESD